MSRRRAKRSTLSVSLFPFLAVLICTLGVLIVLLVLAVKSAEVQANEDQQFQKDRVEEQEAVLKQLQGQLDEAEVKIELIGTQRPESVARLTQSREYRGHLESEIRVLKEKIADLDVSLATVDENEVDSVSADLSKQRIDELNQKILLAQKELDEKREQRQANAKVTYSIVPHAGAGGTYRRPIFIVCKKDAVTIEPLGIRFEKNDFVPPLGPGNPLDAAVLAIREYWKKYDVTESEGSPYPLIIIRPDGAEGYAISRRAMASWEDEFGYELVEADKELDFGEVDQGLKSVVEAAVAEAKSRQRNMTAVRAMQQPGKIQNVGFRSGRGQTGRSAEQRPGLMASGSSGGFVVNSAWEELEQQRFSQNDGSPFTMNGVGSAESAFAVGTGGDGTNRSGSRFDGSQTTQLANNQSGALAGNSENSQEFHSDFEDVQVQSSQTREQSSHQGGQTTSAKGSKSPAGQMDCGDNSSSSTAAKSQGSGEQNDSMAVSSPEMYQHLNLAKSKGKDWAVPNKTPGATAYVRPIRVVCADNELEIRSTLGVEKRIPVGDDIGGAVDPLINEIWRQIESWGIPGEKSYWKPELRISVVSGGELNFEKLQGLLLESGIQIKESPR